MQESEQKAIAEITKLKVRASEMENEIASDDLKFSVWVAAFATAGFGTVLLNANKIIETSWLSSRAGSYMIAGVQTMLAAAIIGAGLVQHLINARLLAGRECINLMNAQLARVLSGHIADAGDIIKNTVDGKYLAEGFRADLKSHESETGKLDTHYKRWMLVQIMLTGLALVGLLVISLRFRR
jgi:hypothetical protein